MNKELSKALGFTALGAVLVVIFLIVADVVDQRPAAQAGSSPVAVAHLSRDEFRALTLGKTMTEVVAAVGAPHSTAEDGSVTSWFYRNDVYDPISGNLGNAHLVIVNGLVVKANFY